MSLDYLIVYESINPKIRVGSMNDGGYVIADTLQYDCLISGGISDDITFEKDFCSRFPSTPCYAFDGTIHKLPEEHPSIQFIKKNITI